MTVGSVPTADNLYVPIVLKSGSLILLETLGPVQTFIRIALPLSFVIFGASCVIITNLASHI